MGIKYLPYCAYAQNRQRGQACQELFLTYAHNSNRVYYKFEAKDLTQPQIDKYEFNLLVRQQLPRPKKIRHCGCSIPGSVFKPTGTPLYELEQIRLQRDELEVLRLCDRDGLVQEQAGIRMGISRGTVQRLLASARKKVAQALVEGAAIIFEEM